MAFNLCYILLGDSHRDERKTELLMPPVPGLEGIPTCLFDFFQMITHLISSAVLNLSLQTDPSAEQVFNWTKQYLVFADFVQGVEGQCRFKVCTQHF